VNVDKIIIIDMIEYFFGKFVERNLIDLNFITIEIAKIKTPVIIIGIKNIPGSNGFMPTSNSFKFLIVDTLLNEEYSAGNNAGIMVKVVTVIENKNTKCEIIGLLENFNIKYYSQMLFYVLK
jgi:hypothetical protein